MKDTSQTKGIVRIQVTNPDGTKHDTGWVKNLGMNVRLAVIAGLYANTGSQTAFTYLALGTSSTAVAASQTTLGAELSTLGLSRTTATITRSTTTVTNDTTQFDYTWTASGSTTINEIGYFNASSNGTMGGRALTTAIPVVNGSQVIATYKVVHS